MGNTTFPNNSWMSNLSLLLFFLYKELTKSINQIELNMNVVLREKSGQNDDDEDGEDGNGNDDDEDDDIDV